MPNYEYLCQKCGYKTEIRLLISERNNSQICPKCKNVLTRLIGNVSGFILKGKGFYCNREQDI